MISLWVKKVGGDAAGWCVKDVCRRGSVSVVAIPSSYHEKTIKSIEYLNPFQ